MCDGSAERSSFTRPAMVRGYHIYNAIWEAYIGEELACLRETDNEHEHYAVSVVKSATVVGLLPRKISTLCSLLIWQGGSIRCRITGHQQYSSDLPQGGMEVPCDLRFEGRKEELEKLQKLLDSFCGENALLQDGTTSSAAIPRPNPTIRNQAAVPAASIIVTDSDSPEKKRPRLADDIETLETDLETSILNGEKLSDKACRIIKAQFLYLRGLQSTLLQSKKLSIILKEQVQVIHDRSDHWIVASNVGCKPKEVNVYDSVFSTVHKETQQVICNLFNAGSQVKVAMKPFHKQVGGMDCGVFVIAAVTGQV